MNLILDELEKLNETNLLGEVFVNGRRHFHLEDQVTLLQNSIIIVG